VILVEYLGRRRGRWDATNPIAIAARGHPSIHSMDCMEGFVLSRGDIVGDYSKIRSLAVYTIIFEHACY
jgi:hypothetical protein